MIGKTDLKKWQYAFNCRNCECIVELRCGIYNGKYCAAGLMQRKTIHADDDRVLRCDCYKPIIYGQLTFEGMML